MADCQAGRAPCPRPVVAILTVGCLHEHLRTGPICAYHLTRHEAGRLCCAECLMHPTHGHDRCPVQELKRELIAA